MQRSFYPVKVKPGKQNFKLRPEFVHLFIIFVSSCVAHSIPWNFYITHLIFRGPTEPNFKFGFWLPDFGLLFVSAWEMRKSVFSVTEVCNFEELDV